MEYTISFTHVSDAENLVMYLNEVAGETDFLTFGENEFFNSVEEERRFIEKLMQSKQGVMLVAKNSAGNIIGSAACLSNERKHQHVFTMALTVKKAFWSQGVGKGFITKMEQESAKLGCEKIMLYVYAQNKRAIRLYESLGYEREAILKRDAKIGKEYVDSWVMVKFV